MPDLGIRAYISAIVISVVLVGVGYAAYRYQSMSSELLETKATLVQQEAENARLADISNRNAEAAKRADEDRRAAVDALEFAQGGIAVNSKTSRLSEADIDAAPDSDDGAVAPVLENLRKARFGSAK
ncbi:hypothetical protein HB770_04010 [Rhizobium leguminosarum bv. viciae]|uniref:Uncharacterized protein n=1 Tax=Rhizobium leguminosarum bv. viciae TaxID=387 RepID=A0A7G6RHS9_RHILV|nr:hypothetical protein HB770_04010 [Rhizobium leguminosarum bv. viciae]